MAIEIRELIIKTEVVNNPSLNTRSSPEFDIDKFSKEILIECKRMMSQEMKNIEKRR